MKKFLVSLLLTITITVSASAQSQTDIWPDSLVQFFNSYGYFEYAIPHGNSWDTVMNAYRDTTFVYITVDSIPIAQQFIDDQTFFMINPNMWVGQGHFTRFKEYMYRINYCDSTIVDTSTVTTDQLVIFFHIVPERAPNFITDLK